MADNTKFGSSMQQMFEGMDKAIGTKTVMGEAMDLGGGKFVIPLADVSFGYSILKDARGKGYGTAGLKLTVEIAKTIIPEDEIYLRVNKDNIASQKVMLKNGAYVAGEDEEHYLMRIPKTTMVFAEKKSMRLLFTIDSEDYQGCTHTYIRNSARSIIIKNNRIAIVES